MSGILLAIFSGTTFSLADTFRKILGQKMDAASLNFWLHLFQLPFLFVLLIYLPGSPDQSNLNADYWLYAAPSIAANILANFLFLRSLQLTSIGLAIPLLSTTPVFSMLWGILFLGEMPVPAAFLGIALIIIPALFLPGTEVSDRWLCLVRPDKGSIYMILVSFLWSIAIIFDKLCLEKTSVSIHLSVLVASTAIFFAIIYVLNRRKAIMKRQNHSIPVILLTSTALLLIAALLMQFFALHSIEAAYVEAIKRGSSPILSIFWGYFFFQETSAVRKLALAFVMAVGVVIVVFS